MYVDDIKLAGKKHNIDPMWKVLKVVELGEPTSFLDHVYLGCTQRQCEISKDIVDNYRAMFESRISAAWTEKLPFPQNIRISSWSYDMAGHATKCVERCCELANKTTQKCLLHALMTTTSKKARLLWERQFAKVQLKYGWEKVPNWECLFGNREKGLLLSVYVDDIKLAGKKQNISPTWKILLKDVDLEQQTSFLDHVFLGCTQRQCDISKGIVDNYRAMFESRISACGTEKLPYSENLRISS